MRRQAVGASLAVIVLVFTSLVSGQQLNPFTAVLTSDLERRPVKSGRKRVTLQDVSHSPKKSSRSSKPLKETAESARPVDKKVTGPKSDEKSPAHTSKASADKPRTDMIASETEVVLTPEEDALDLRRQIGVKYQILTEKNGELSASDPKRVYHSGEAFRIRIEANINANLYLLAEDARTGERQLIFPNYKYQRGVERVKPFSPVVVPPLGQPAFAFDHNPGEERIIVICSRDEIPALQLAPVESYPEAAKLVSPKVLPNDIEQSIGKQHNLGSRDFVWVSDKPAANKTPETYVVNTSKKDNEEVVYVIRLKHGD